MRIWLLTNATKNAPPGTAIQMVVVTDCLEGETTARALAADKAGIEGPAEWTNPALSTCSWIGFAFAFKVRRGVIALQKA